MTYLTHPDYTWGIELTPEQIEAGSAAAAKEGATHWRIFTALREAGVPARGDKPGSYPASHAATLLWMQGYRAPRLQVGMHL